MLDLGVERYCMNNSWYVNHIAQISGEHSYLDDIK